MIKKFILCLFLLAPFACLFAQNPDSVAYQLQRQRINNMLAQRSEKFSQYTKSLDEHTGIFGWQTKKDIKHSGEILMDIVRTDDSIFKELKVLFDYKTFQQNQVQQHSQESENLIPGYMLTINKLRAQNELLLKQQKDEENAFEKRQGYYLILIVVLALISIFLFSRRKKRKRY